MRVQGSAGGTAREFAFHCREDAFDRGASSILFCGKVLAHLEAHTGCPATGAAFGRDDTLSLELLAAKGVVAFRIEFGVGQHATYGCLPMRLGNQHGQRGAVVPGRLSRMLGQDELPLHIDRGEPLQPMLPSALGLAKMLYPADEVAADRSLCQACGVHRYGGRTSPPPRHAPHDFVHPPRHIGRIKPGQKAIQRGVVGNGIQFEGGAQLRVLPQADLSLAKGPVLITHQAKHGQQLRLRELPLAELRALRGQNGPTDFQSQPGKPHQSYLSHNDCEEPEKLQLNPIPATFHTRVPRMSTEPDWL